MPDRDLQFFERVAALRRAGQSFAVATVVSRRAPVSSHLGDRAVIYPDGRMEGFVGGSCSREIVRRQALETLTLGAARLVQIRPDRAMGGVSPDGDHVVVPMSCASEGEVDVYVEPHLPPPLLLVAGVSLVADALARAGQALEYEVVRVVTAEEQRDIEGVDTEGGPEQTITLGELGGYLGALPADRRRLLAAVVASQGYYDELALEALLAARPLYLGLLSSRKRGATAREVLLDRGIAPTELDAIHNPAGLDLGATTPAEVAVSILADIVQVRKAWERERGSDVPVTDAAWDVVATRTTTDLARAVVATRTTTTDPVCGMEVDLATALHTAEHDGATYAFCCPHCKASFERNPARYLAPAEVS